MYVADKANGIFAIESKADGSFSEVRRVPKQSGMESVSTMVAVAMQAVYLIAASTFITGALLV